MGTIWVREFTGGLDTRRMSETTQGGALKLARDGHINRGGEFEQRAAFVKTNTLLAGTVGIALGRGSLFVFGSVAAPVMPTGYTYQRLQHPNGTTALSFIYSVDVFDGKLYVVALFEDGSYHHYYDGTIVSDWEDGSAGSPRGIFARTINDKIYTLSGSILAFSGVSAPSQFDSGTTGAGFIDMSKQAADAENMRAVAEYQNLIAIFGDNVILVWYVDPDPALNKKSQVLKNTGAVAARSVVGFGDNDLFYLAESGVRSLRARDASNSAATTDIGVPIDTLIIAKLQTLTALEKSRVVGFIEPSSGRFWLVMKDEIFVFSYFPGSKVSAWSTYLPTYFDDNGDKQTIRIDDATVYQRHVYIRSGDDVFVYGGLGAVPVYDATEPEMWTPYLDAGKPAQGKTLDGLDVACVGAWEVRVALDPTNDEASDKIGIVDKSTFNVGRIPAEGDPTHVSLRFKGVGAGFKKISSALIHYTPSAGADDDDA